MGQKLLILAFLSIFILTYIPAELKSQSQKAGLMDIITLTLENQPDIQIKRQDIAIEAGNLMIASAPLDYGITANIARQRDNSPYINPLGIVFPQINYTSYSLGIRKTYDFGITVEPVVQYYQTQINNIPNLDPIARNRAAVFFNFTFPLMKGLFGEGLKSRIEAQTFLHSSKVNDYKYTLSQSIYNSAAAYWKLLFARNTAEIARKSLDRERSILMQTTELANADELPKSEIISAEASLSLKRIEFDNSMKMMNDAVSDLYAKTGKKPGFNNNPELIDEFPTPDLNANPKFDELLNLSIQNRQDIKELEKSIKSSEFLLAACEDNQKQDLSLNMTLGYSGYDAGSAFKYYFLPFKNNTSDLNFTLGIAYTFPIRNDLAKGEYIKQEALLEQQKLNLENKKFEIEKEINQALNAYNSYRMQYFEAANAFKLFTTVYSNEIEKLKAGQSTLTEVNLAEEKLSSAEAILLSVKLNYSITILDIRLATGTIVKFDMDKNQTNFNMLTTAPKKLTE